MSENWDDKYYLYLPDPDNIQQSISLNNDEGTGTLGYNIGSSYVNKAMTVNVYTKKTNPQFSAIPTGSSSAISTNASLDSINHSGISIQTQYAINQANISYKEDASGWINKKAGDSANNSKTTATPLTDGQLYYLNGVTLTIPNSGTQHTFAITVPNGDNNTITFNFTVDSNGNTTVT